MALDGEVSPGFLIQVDPPAFSGTGHTFNTWIPFHARGSILLALAEKSIELHPQNAKLIIIGKHSLHRY